MDAASPQLQSAISLPKGGGAVKGIGETFQPNLFTGTGDFSVPIATSPGRAGFGPQLKLQYSTGNGNGPFGLGWDLSIPVVTRKTEKGLPRYTDDDVFVLSGAEDLVVCEEQPPPGYAPPGYTVTRFRPRTEGLFARIERWVRDDGDTQRDDGDTHWCATTRDNVTSLYGKSAKARLADPANPRRVFQWLLEESFDSKGNHILYEYVQENTDRPGDAIFEQNRRPSQCYIRRILYGNTPNDLLEAQRAGPVRSGAHHLHHRDPDRTLARHYLFEVLFDYGDQPETLPIPYQLPSAETTIPNTWPMREDRFSTFRSGFEVRTLRRCRRVLMLHHFTEGELNGTPLVKSTDFAYRVDPNTQLSFLTAVSVSGYRKGADNRYVSANMPPVDFAYSSFKPEKQRYQSVTAEGNDLPPRSLDATGFNLVDLFGDALPDILRTSETGYNIWRNLGGGHIERRRPQQGPLPPVSPAQPNAAFGDMGGDGLVDLVVDAPPVSGFFEATPDGQWQPFRRFARFPSLNLADPNLRLVDLTGDGLTDILITRDRHFLWYRCLGEEGYAEPEAIGRVHDLDAFPDVFFSDPAGRVRLADMTGDGLNDIVLVHDGHIDYWPNLGYGRFGRRITMAAAPRIGHGFDPRRLFLVDLDGSGCADIAYVDADCVHLWFNRSGNSWSEQHTITGTPPVTNLTAIQFADFFGTGTASLVWSYDYAFQRGGNYKVLDFCGGQKPYLLTEVSNNLGATTRVQYAPSTKFYLEDRANGQPWISALPFPVQVVEKVEVIDHIGRTKLVSRYKYHHGYFDGREREFRGFGRVDQFDSEVFEDFNAPGLHGETARFDNRDPAFHQPPVETRTWFHTGIYFDPDRHLDHRELTERYRAEYYQGDDRAFGLTDHAFEQADGSSGLGQAPHEAFRALRGAILRTEVYGRDGTLKQMHPYTVTESRYRVRALQAPHDGRHGVYFTSAMERLSFHYERNPADPSIGHELTLAMDDFGNVTRSAAVAYQRREPQHIEQGRLLVSYAEADFINKADENDWSRVGVPCETRAYELTGLHRADETRPFTVQEVADAAAAAPILPYEAEPDEEEEGKRLLDATRTRYLADDLSRPLSLGEVGRHGLPYEGYQMALTPGLVQNVFNIPESRVNERLLYDEGRYVQGREIHAAGDLRDEAWWILSGRQQFSPDCFFLPVVYTDPFDSTFHSTYDEYCLLVSETRDPLQNTVSALNDYRVLQPWQLTDPNGNRSRAAFDALGLVVGTAVMGKESETLGDSLAGFSADLDEETRLAHIAAPFADPHAILQGATTRLVYDLFAYQRTRGEPEPQPATVYTLARETHLSDLDESQQTRIQHSFTYSDGFGRESQKKIQAEPGLLIDAEGEPEVSPRWVGSGWTVFNNKGKPVRQYEPFFSASHGFEFARTVGVSPMLFYDPLGRVVATLHPNRTWEKVDFDPWRQETWDVNDTVRTDPREDPDVGAIFRCLPMDAYLPTWHAVRTDPALALIRWPNREPNTGAELPQNAAIRSRERSAAEKAAMHAATPTLAHFDTLGRPFLAISNNGKDEDGEDILYETMTVLDIEGNQREVIDAMGRIVMRYDYDMLGNRIHQASMEAGERWMLGDAAGSPLHGWDSRGHTFRTVYDPLRRPLEAYVRGADPDNPEREILHQRTEYGESLSDEAAARRLNLRTRVYRLYDSAGLVIYSGPNPATGREEAYDFKGNLLRSQRQLAPSYRTIPDWAVTPAPETEPFTSSTAYDALNRPTEITAPDNSVVRPTYNEANLLERLDVNLRGSDSLSTFVENIDYNAKGQRVLIEYGNGVRTLYTYDTETFRLIHLHTTRPPLPNGLAGELFIDPTTVQDLRYAFDPAGNITSIRDDALPVIHYDNGEVHPVSNYTYDAIYRLITAEGREHIGQNALLFDCPNDNCRDYPFTGLRVHPNDRQALSNYTEHYDYDEVGNFESMRHYARNGDWVRIYDYEEPSQIEPEEFYSNRLSRTTIVGRTENYTHDIHGNMTRMPHLAQMDWDFKDQLQRVDLGGGGTAYYDYDATGQRVRKVIERLNGTIQKERIYLGGYEVYREYNGRGDNPTLERETLYIMDDQQRIAMVETRTAGHDEAPRQLLRYQLGNHLGSASLELDTLGQVISYEEYHPYGTSSYQAMRSQTETPKRYRYTGMERDEETGFNYHRARYYALWLGRWVSADPLLKYCGTVKKRMQRILLSQIKLGLNYSYTYVSCNPQRYLDQSGLNEEEDESNFGLLLGFAGAVIGAMAGLLAGGIATSPTGPGMIGGAVVGALSGAGAGYAIGRDIEYIPLFPTDIVEYDPVDIGPQRTRPPSRAEHLRMNVPVVERHIEAENIIQIEPIEIDVSSDEEEIIQLEPINIIGESRLNQVPDQITDVQPQTMDLTPLEREINEIVERGIEAENIIQIEPIEIDVSSDEEEIIQLEPINIIGESRLNQVPDQITDVQPQTMDLTPLEREINGVLRYGS